jgi:hypothetical protein
MIDKDEVKAKLEPNDIPLEGSILEKKIRSIVETSEDIEETATALSNYFDDLKDEERKRKIRRITKKVVFEYSEKLKNGYSLSFEGLEYEIGTLEKNKFYITDITDNEIECSFLKPTVDFTDNDNKSKNELNNNSVIISDFKKDFNIDDDNTNINNEVNNNSVIISNFKEDINIVDDYINKKQTETTQNQITNCNEISNNFTESVFVDLKGNINCISQYLKNPNEITCKIKIDELNEKDTTKFTKENTELLYPKLLKKACEKYDIKLGANKEKSLSILKIFQEKSIVKDPIDYKNLNILLGRKTSTYQNFQNKIDLIDEKPEPITEKEKAEDAYQKWITELDSGDLDDYKERVSPTLSKIKADLEHPKWVEIYKRIHLIELHERLTKDGKYLEEKEIGLQYKDKLEKKQVRLPVSNLYPVLYLRENLIKDKDTNIAVIEHLCTEFLRSTASYSAEDICSDNWPVWNLLTGNFVSTTNDGFLGLNNLLATLFSLQNKLGIQRAVFKNLLFMQKYSADKKIDILVVKLENELENNNQNNNIQIIKNEVESWFNNWERQNAEKDIENVLTTNENLDDLDNLLDYLDKATIQPQDIHDFLYKNDHKACRKEIVKWINSALNQGTDQKTDDVYLKTIAQAISDYFIFADDKKINKEEYRQLIMTDTIFILIRKLPAEKALRVLNVFTDLPIVTKHLNIFSYGQTEIQKECHKQIQEYKEKIKQLKLEEIKRNEELQKIEKEKNKQEQADKLFINTMFNLIQVEKSSNLSTLEKIETRINQIDIFRKYSKASRKILDEAQINAYNLLLNFTIKTYECDLHLKQCELELYKRTFSDNDKNKDIKNNIVQHCEKVINEQLNNYTPVIANKIKERKEGLQNEAEFRDKNEIKELIKHDKLIGQYRHYLLATSSNLKISKNVKTYIDQKLNKIMKSDPLYFKREKTFIRNQNSDQISDQIDQWCNNELDVNTTQCYYKLWTNQSYDKWFYQKVKDIFWKVLGWQKPHDSNTYKNAGVNWTWVDFFPPAKESTTGKFVHEMANFNTKKTL